MTQAQLMDLKKRLCDPPATLVALNGDPEIAGLFQGVTDLIDSDVWASVPEALQAQYLADVVAAEGAYLDGRRNAAGEALTGMTKLRVRLLEALGEA